MGQKPEDCETKMERETYMKSSDSLFRFTRGVLLKKPEVEGVGVGEGGGAALLLIDSPLNNITALEEFSFEVFHGIWSTLQL